MKKEEWILWHIGMPQGWYGKDGRWTQCIAEAMVFESERDAHSFSLKHRIRAKTETARQANWRTGNKGRI